MLARRQRAPDTYRRSHKGVAVAGGEVVRKIAALLVLLVALEHIYILVLEMFLWTHPIGLRAFGLTPELAEQSATLAANQGLYNGFLAAGLLWGLIRKYDDFPIKVFFLCCVIIAGIYGGLTAKPSILLVQAGPALLALIFVFAAQKRRSNLL